MAEGREYAAVFHNLWHKRCSSMARQRLMGWRKMDFWPLERFNQNYSHEFVRNA
jgi:hypothetical protein